LVSILTTGEADGNGSTVEDVDGAKGRDDEDDVVADEEESGEETETDELFGGNEAVRDAVDAETNEKEVGSGADDDDDEEEEEEEAEEDDDNEEDET
jgi:hypothetical protein